MEPAPNRSCLTRHKTSCAPAQNRRASKPIPFFGKPCRFERWPDIPIHVLAGRDDRFFRSNFNTVSPVKGLERR
jgi:hypothetical protein